MVCRTGFDIEVSRDRLPDTVVIRLDQNGVLPVARSHEMARPEHGQKLIEVTRDAGCLACDFERDRLARNRHDLQERPRLVGQMRKSRFERTFERDVSFVSGMLHELADEERASP